MALGKPIVQFDLTEGRFSAGEASLYARANDVRDFAVQLSSLLDDPQQRARMGAAGRERIESELAWHHQVPHLLRAYETVFGGEPAGRRSGPAAAAVTHESARR
jgi:glycosyltransferase involved in cell wall biosynthesis